MNASDFFSKLENSGMCGKIDWEPLNPETTASTVCFTIDGKTVSVCINKQNNIYTVSDLTVSVFFKRHGLDG